MASTSISGDAAPVTLPGTMPPMPAVARILARHDRSRLAAFVTVAIDLMDAMDPDPEAEENALEDAFVNHDPDCAFLSEDNEAGAYVEWHTMRGSQKRGPNIVGRGEEDDEEDDPSGQSDEDGINTLQVLACGGGAGCKISDGDHGIDDLPHDQEQDAECEQMADDVPMLPVYSAEHNIFTDQRASLGYSNLQSSFRSNGGEVRSADTGAGHRSTGEVPRHPGAPV